MMVCVGNGSHWGLEWGSGVYCILSALGFFWCVTKCELFTSPHCKQLSLRYCLLTYCSYLGPTVFE